MYESQVNSKTESITRIPPNIREEFAGFVNKVRSRTLLPWGEHCTECNWPTCYTTCELYTPRVDGGCRLFVEGMVRLDAEAALNSYLMKIRFKRWGKLWTPGNLRLHRVSDALRREKVHQVAGLLALNLPFPKPFKRRFLGKIGSVKRRLALLAQPSDRDPDCFLLECYNPNDFSVDLTVSMRYRESEGGLDPHKPAFFYQKRIVIEPGFKRTQITISDIRKYIDLRKPFNIEILPNNADDLLLYFGALDFVELVSDRASADPEEKAAKWKCVVWDLDNTIWDGILIEKGPENVRPKPGVVEVIRELDQRGILHSIASKNNCEDALKVLRQHRLEEFFLHPQISWQPKSQSIARIAQLLNISRDTLAFVDDQAFELEEVGAAFPEIARIDAANYREIPERRECLVPITQESRRRRMMYREQEKRHTSLEGHRGDYKGFLKACRIRLKISRLRPQSLDRVYELAQRTNQMNFSGHRYPRSELEVIMQSKSSETFVVDCSDKFGSYGIVGFSVVDTQEPRLLDLMFSCRIQSKRVEHAFLSYLLKRFVETEARDFYANFRRTIKNAGSGKVFEDIGFEHLSTSEEGYENLMFPRRRTVPDEGIIDIEENQPQVLK